MSVCFFFVPPTTRTVTKYPPARLPSESYPIFFFFAFRNHHSLFPRGGGGGGGVGDLPDSALPSQAFYLECPGFSHRVIVPVLSALFVDPTTTSATTTTIKLFYLEPSWLSHRVINAVLSSLFVDPTTTAATTITLERQTTTTVTNNTKPPPPP